MKKISLTFEGKTMMFAEDQLNKTQFSVFDIIGAREYWDGLTLENLLGYWQHYTIGKGAGMYQAVKADTSFADYLVLSAQQSAFERQHDI